MKYWTLLILLAQFSSANINGTTFYDGSVTGSSGIVNGTKFYDVYTKEDSSYNGYLSGKGSDSHLDDSKQEPWPTDEEQLEIYRKLRNKK